MKNQIILALSLAVSLMVTDLSSNYKWLYDTDGYRLPMKVVAADSAIVISPIPDQDSGSHGPRMPGIIPISASYESMLSSVLLTFTSNLGEIEVEVMNTTTGDYISEMIDTLFLSATVPITMGPGHYLILFTLPSGRQYKGEFVL